MSRTSQSEVGAIQRLILKHPRDAFESDEVISSQWRQLHYEDAPDFKRSVSEYDDFVELLQGFEIEIHYLPNSSGTGLDSVYVRDAVILCDKGAILCNMGKQARKGEPAAQESLLSNLGVPVVGSITGAGSVEGGDVAWIDERTLAVGRGYRTNDEGIR